MWRKVTVFSLFVMLSSPLFSNESDKFSIFKSDANVKDYFIATGEAFITDLLIYDFNTLILQNNSQPVNFDVFKKNFQNPWVWDYSSFNRNQFMHPYMGSLFFVSGRANNLNFLESFLLSTAGTFFWETYLEGPTPSVNDMITTPTAGAIYGEILHRLYFLNWKVFPPLSFLLSPVDGINFLLTGKNANKYCVIPYKTEWDLTGGATFTKTNYTDTKTSASLGTSLYMIYNNPYGHTSKEFFDTFTIDIVLSGFGDNYLHKIYLDGNLYSHALYISEKNPSSLFISFDYDILTSSDFTLSNSLFGIGFNQKINLEKNKQDIGEKAIEYLFQSDFAYLSTSDIFYATNNQALSYVKPKNQPDYTFKYGIVEKIYFSYVKQHNFLCSLNADFQYFWTYNTLNASSELNSNLLLFSTDFKVQYSLFEDVLWLGLRDFLVYKYEINPEKGNSYLVSNSVLIYCELRL